MASCCDKLAVLSLPLPKGQPSSPRAEQWSGKTYKLESNDLKLESVAIKFGHERSTLIVRDERGEHPMQVGYATWLKGTTDLRGHGDEPVAACGAWTAEDTYEVQGLLLRERVLPGLPLPLHEWRTATGSGAKRILGSPTVMTITGRVAGGSMRPTKGPLSP